MTPEAQISARIRKNWPIKQQDDGTKTIVIDGRVCKLCPDCDQPMRPRGVKKKPNEYDHASGCPRAGKKK